MALWIVASQYSTRHRYGVLRTNSTDGRPVWEAIASPLHIPDDRQVDGIDFEQDLTNPNILHIVVYSGSGNLQSDNGRIWYSQFDMTLEDWVVGPIEVIPTNSTAVYRLTLSPRDNGNAVISYLTDEEDGSGNFIAYWCEYDDASGTVSAPVTLDLGPNGLGYHLAIDSCAGVGGLVHVFLPSSSNSLTHRSITSAGVANTAEWYAAVSTPQIQFAVTSFIDDSLVRQVAVASPRPMSGSFGDRIYFASSPSAEFMDSAASEVIAHEMPTDESFTGEVSIAGHEDKAWISYMSQISSTQTIWLFSGFGSTWSDPEEVIHHPDTSGHTNEFAQIVMDGDSIVLMAFDETSGYRYHTVKYIESSKLYEEYDLPVTVTATVTSTDGAAFVENVVVDASVTVTGTDAGPLEDELLEVLATSVVEITDQHSLIEQASVSAVAEIEATHVQAMVDDPFIDAVSTVTATDDMGGLARTVEVGAITWVAQLATSVRADLAAQWHVRDAVQDDLGLLWKVTGPVGKSIESTWAVEAAVGKGLDAQWGVETQAGAVGRNLALDWDVTTSTGDEVTALWDVIQSFTVTVNLDVRWDALVSASNVVSTPWDTYIVRTEERTLNAAKSPEERRPISRSERRDSDPAVALRVTRT